MRSHRPMGSGRPSLVSSATRGATERRPRAWRSSYVQSTQRYTHCSGSLTFHLAAVLHRCTSGHPDITALCGQRGNTAFQPQSGRVFKWTMFYRKSVNLQERCLYSGATSFDSFSEDCVRLELQVQIQSDLQVTQRDAAHQREHILNYQNRWDKKHGGNYWKWSERTE